MKKIISIFALVSSLAAWAGYEVPASWKSQYKTPFESHLGWSEWDIYQSQSWMKRHNPRLNVSNLLPKPKVTANIYWSDYSSHKSGKAFAIFHYADGEPGMKRSDQVKFKSDVTVSLPYQKVSFENQISNNQLRKGKFYVEVFLDIDGNDEWTPGEPYGVATKKVTVGWNSADFDVNLTDIAPQMFRINMLDAAQANDFESQKPLNDRGVQNSIGITSNDAMYEEYIGQKMPMAIETETRVRIVRMGINGQGAKIVNHVTNYVTGVVLDTTRNFNVNPTFGELDVLRDGKFDLDWGTVDTPARIFDLPLSGITSLTYRVVLGDGTTLPREATNNNTLATAFVNRFELGGAGLQSKCVPVSPKGTVYSAAPTFKWTHKNTINKDYPAFRLRVWNGSKVVYDSGNRRATARDADGNYSWTAPIYANMTTTSNKVILCDTPYKWSVSMLDAKFTTPNNTENKADLIMSPAGKAQDIAGYGTISAQIKYSGSVSVNSATNQTANALRVQAFVTPDFSRSPAVSESRVVNVSDLASENGATVHLYALPVGIYYIRAYIDVNGNGEYDDEEPWGFSMIQDGKMLPKSVYVRPKASTNAQLIVID